MQIYDLHMYICASFWPCKNAPNPGMVQGLNTGCLSVTLALTGRANKGMPSMRSMMFLKRQRNPGTGHKTTHCNVETSINWALH